MIFDYFINGVKLDRVAQVKDLGVLLDQDLRFNSHISKITSKAFRNLGFVYRNSKEFRNPNTFRTLYCSLVRPGLEYCSTLWSPQYNIWTDEIESVQKKFLRFLRFKDYSNRQIANNDLLKKYDLLPLKHRRQIIDIVFVYKVLNFLIDCPDVLQNINLRTNISHTRNRDTFTVKRYNTNIGGNSPLNRSLKLCNIIGNPPYNIDLFNESLQTLKQKLAMLFVEHQILGT
uniref:Uncharacterized protein n=1 Tax=Cacopsylla melanoneura TaxID=428564 RepID=A0A8D8Z4X9_9HEMI